MMLDPEHWRWSPDLDDLTELSAQVPDPGVKARNVIKGLRDKHRCFHARKENALLLVIQGVDASGKNSLLRHLARNCNIRFQ